MFLKSIVVLSLIGFILTAMLLLIGLPGVAIKVSNYVYLLLLFGIVGELIKYEAK